MPIAGVVLQIKGPAFRFTVGRVILPKPSSPCRGYKREPVKWFPFVFLRSVSAVPRNTLGIILYTRKLRIPYRWR